MLVNGDVPWIGFLVRTWFRYSLRINGDRSSVGQKRIIRITPNSLEWDMHNQKVAEFRTHNKFSKRLLYGFYPLWWMMHQWDMIVANTFRPSWNLGFDTLTVYPDASTSATTVDGRAVRNNTSTETFSTLRAGAGTAGEPSAVNDFTLAVVASSTTDQYTILTRGIFLFDTSSIADGATIDTATFSQYLNSELNQLSGDSSANSAMVVVGSTPASNNNIVASDYGQLGSTELGRSGNQSTFSFGTYTDVILNDTGEAAISKTGITKLGTRYGWDFDNTTTGLTWSSGGLQGFNGSYADETGNTKDPKLVVIYTAIVLPTVTTETPASDITSVSASGGGNVTSDGGGTVSERGIAWGASTNPTIAGDHQASGSGTGSFTGVAMTGLNPNTHYYYRAYATNEIGTAYGANVEFDTPVQFSEINSEAEGKQPISSEIISEVVGSGSYSEIISEVHGVISATSEINSELLGTLDQPKKLGYRIIIKDENGNEVGEAPAPRKLSFSKRLNDYGRAKWDIRVSDPQAASFVALRKNTIEIHRESGTALTLVWAGEQALVRGELNEAGNNWAAVHAFTWFEQLYHRYTSEIVTYTEIDQGAIMVDLINDTNADDPTKITIGTTPATKIRDRAYHSQNIAEAIINLSNVASGTDFEVTDLGVFNAESIIGTDKTSSVVFRYGHNIKNVTIIEDFTSPINRAIVLGEATGETELTRVDRNELTLQGEYGLREGRLQEMDISSISTLEDKGDAAIRKYGQPLLHIEFDLVRNVSPSIDEFTVGDGIRLIIQNGMYTIDEQYRVYEWEITWDEKSTETLKLTLGTFITL